MSLGILPWTQSISGAYILHSAFHPNTFMTTFPHIFFKRQYMPLDDLWIQISCKADIIHFHINISEFFIYIMKIVHKVMTMCQLWSHLEGTFDFGSLIEVLIDVLGPFRSLCNWVCMQIMSRTFLKCDFKIFFPLRRICWNCLYFGAHFQIVPIQLRIFIMFLWNYMLSDFHQKNNA